MSFPKRCKHIMSSPRILIYLLRRDLRLVDNPILHEISKTFQQSKHPYTHLLPVYVFAAQQIEVSGFLSSDSQQSPFPEARSLVGGFWRCGPHRSKIVAESVWDLKKSLESVGNGLEIRVGLLDQVVAELLDAFKKNSIEVAGVWMTEEEGTEEKKEERLVKRAAQSAQTEFKLWVDEKYYVDESVDFRLYVSMLTRPTAGMFLYRAPVIYQIFTPATANKSSLFEMPLVQLSLHRLDFHLYLRISRLSPLLLPFLQTSRASSTLSTNLSLQNLASPTRPRCHRMPQAPTRSKAAKPRVMTASSIS